MKTALSALVLSLAATCPQLEAGFVYPDCVAGTLQSYVNSSGCILGEGEGSYVVFSGFAFPTPVGTGGATVLDASQIELTPQSSGLGGSFDFSPVDGDFTVGENQAVTYDIDYFLLLDPAPVLGGGSLHLDPSGDVSVTDSICADSYFASDTECGYNTPNGVVYSSPQSFSVDNSNPPYSLALEFELNPPAYNFASVETAISLTGTATEGASSGGVVVGDDVETLPEPVTSLLCLGGLIAIGIFRRRFMV
jgi:hypothetical protein